MIETPEEVAKRIVVGDEQLHFTIGGIPIPGHYAHKARSLVAQLIRERDAAHAAQLAQAREAAMDEAATMLDGKVMHVAANDVRRLKARPVAAGGK